jgi:hypothetical protein
MEAETWPHTLRFDLGSHLSLLIDTYLDLAGYRRPDREAPVPDRGIKLGQEREVMKKLPAPPAPARRAVSHFIPTMLVR